MPSLCNVLVLLALRHGSAMVGLPVEPRSPKSCCRRKRNPKCRARICDALALRYLKHTLNCVQHARQRPVGAPTSWAAGRPKTSQVCEVCGESPYEHALSLASESTLAEGHRRYYFRASVELRQSSATYACFTRQCVVARQHCEPAKASLPKESPQAENVFLA